MNDNLLESVIESTAAAVSPAKTKPLNCKRLERVQSDVVWYKTTRKRSFAIYGYINSAVDLKFVHNSKVLKAYTDYPLSVSVETKTLSSQGFIFDNVVLDRFTEHMTNHIKILNEKAYYGRTGVKYIEFKDLLELTIDNFLKLYTTTNYMTVTQINDYRFTVEIFDIVITKTNKSPKVLAGIRYSEFLTKFGRKKINAKTK